MATTTPDVQGTLKKAELLNALSVIVGRRHVLTDEAATRRYRTGFRFGNGPALAVVRPGALVELWRVLQACARASAIIIMQASNTGLTGGSTPDGATYDRDIVIISTLRMTKISLIDEGRQVICFAGATLFDLENILKPPGPRAAFRNRLVLHRRRGGRRDQQQFGRSAHPSRPRLYSACPIRADRRSGQGRVGQSSGRQTRRRSRDDCRAARPRRLHATPTSSTIRTAPHRITTIRAGCATSTPIRRRGSTRIRSGCSKLPAVPAR